ncbi:MAG: archaetidylserine decarboxylase [Gammaproteobacteria bacterium]|nr:archaetidylserine decarboxylase [Gammaproteobacteria bacterium]
MMLRLTRCECQWLLKLLLPLFISRFKVNMDEAKDPDWRNYASFNYFFTRELKEDARKICSGKKSLACPVDGAISQMGKINNDLIFQAKGHAYSLTQLLGDREDLAEAFKNGQFNTIYLSPKDYHRIHMPIEGTLKEMIHVPGELFSVNPTTVENVPALFARNERVICLFDTAAGPMAMILVGAIFVASIETVWHGVVTPPTGKSIQTWTYDDEGMNKSVTLAKGEEMGRFNMGSTVILLYPENVMEWEKDVCAERVVKLGEKIGKLLH